MTSDEDESNAQGGMAMTQSNNEDCQAALDLFLAEDKIPAPDERHQDLIDKIKEVQLLVPDKEI